MEHRRSELAAIFALALLASITALELDYEVFSAVFAAAAGVAAFENARSQWATVPASARWKREAEEDWGKRNGDVRQNGSSSLELSRVGRLYWARCNYTLGSGPA
jgi:hypothetical protein